MKKNTSIAIQLPVKQLAQREIEILTLTAYGKTRSEIAQILSIKSATVTEYMKRVFHKLNVSNNTHASTVAIAVGLIAPYRIPIDQICSSCHAKNVPQRGDRQADEYYVLEKDKKQTTSNLKSKLARSRAHKK